MGDRLWFFALFFGLDFSNDDLNRLLKFFEENDQSGSSSDEEFSNLSSGEYSQKSSYSKKDAKLDAHLRVRYIPGFFLMFVLIFFN